jgi:hypothetical protein
MGLLVANVAPCSLEHGRKGNGGMPYSRLLRVADVAEALTFLTRLPLPSPSKHRGARPLGLGRWPGPCGAAGGGDRGRGAVAGPRAGTDGGPGARRSGARHRGAARGRACRQRRRALGRGHARAAARDHAGQPDRQLRRGGAGARGAAAVERAVGASGAGLGLGTSRRCGRAQPLAMAWMLAALPPAREGGLSRLVGRPSGWDRGARWRRGHRAGSARGRLGRVGGGRRGPRGGAPLDGGGARAAGGARRATPAGRRSRSGRSRRSSRWRPRSASRASAPAARRARARP